MSSIFHVSPQAAENVRALMDSLPPMRPLVMVLKVFLQQRDLNEVRIPSPDPGILGKILMP